MNNDIENHMIQNDCYALGEIERIDREEFAEDAVNLFDANEAMNSDSKSKSIQGMTGLEWLEFADKHLINYENKVNLLDDTLPNSVRIDILNAISELTRNAIIRDMEK